MPLRERQRRQIDASYPQSDDILGAGGEFLSISADWKAIEQIFDLINALDSSYHW